MTPCLARRSHCDACHCLAVQPDLVDWLRQQQSGGNGAGQRLLAARLERADGILEALHTFGFK